MKNAECCLLILPPGGLFAAMVFCYLNFGGEDPRAYAR
jgi:hypothetical protein